MSLISYKYLLAEACFYNLIEVKKVSTDFAVFLNTKLSLSKNIYYFLIKGCYSTKGQFFVCFFKFGSCPELFFIYSSTYWTYNYSAKHFTQFFVSSWNCWCPCDEGFLFHFHWCSAPIKKRHLTFSSPFVRFLNLK